MNPPLLFLHGFHGNHLGLQDIAKLLPEYSTLLPDIPPAGGLTLEDYDPRHYADFIAKYIQDNHLKKPVLIGHSMGSIVASATAAFYPELLDDKLILLSPISKAPPRPIASLSPLTALTPDKIVGYASTKYMLIKQSDASSRQVLDKTYASAADQSSRRDVYRSARFSSKYAIPDFDFKKQTYLIAGEKDRLISQSSTRALAKKLGTEPIFIKNSGHLINYESPDQVAAAIKQILRGAGQK